MVDTLWTLPDGWEWVALDKICKLLGGGTPKRSHSEYFDGDIIWVTPTDLDINNPIQKINDSQTKITQLGLNSSSAKLLPAGTILFSSRATIGKIGIASVPLSTNQGFANLVCNEGFDNHYLAWSLKRFTENIKQLASSTTYLEISKGNLRKFKIPIPYPKNPQLSLDIQQRIVARIESLFEEIKRNRLLLEQMRLDNDELMDSALNEVFSHIRQGFEVTGISQDEIKSIDEIAKIERGKFSHRPRNDPRFFGGDMPWIQIQNIPKDGNKFIIDYMNTLNEKGIAISKIFPKGTLVLSIAATIGAVGILTFDSCFPDSLVGITPNNDEVDSGFLYWQLLYIRNHLETIAPAAAQKNINLQILRKINLWIPEKNQQKLIDNHLNFIQEKKQEIEAFIREDIQNFKYLEQAILEKAFRGEL